MARNVLRSTGKVVVSYDNALPFSTRGIRVGVAVDPFLIDRDQPVFRISPLSR